MCSRPLAFAPQNPKGGSGMKKISLLVAVLLCLGVALGFAEEAKSPVSVGLSVDARAKFNYDIDAANAYISNFIRADLNLTFGDAAKDNKESGDVYGYVSLSNIVNTYRQRYLATSSATQDYIDGGNVPSLTAAGPLHWIYDPAIEAKVVMGPAWVEIAGAAVTDAIGVDQFSIKRKLKDYKLISTTTDYVITGTDYAGVYYPVSGNFRLGADVPDLVSLSVGVGSGYREAVTGSQTVYALDTATGLIVQTTQDVKGMVDKNSFVVNLDLAVKAIKDLTLTLGLVQGFNYNEYIAGVAVANNPLAFGVATAYKLPIAEGISLSPYVGFDGRYNALNAGLFEMEVGGGVTLGWPGASGLCWSEQESSGFTPYESRTKSNRVEPGLALGVNYISTGLAGAANDMNVVLSTYEEGVAGLVPGLGFAGMVEVKNLLSTMGLGISAYLDYTIADVTPYAWVKVANTTSTTAQFCVGAALKMIKHTTFTLQYKSGDVLASKFGALGLEAKITM